VESAGMQQLPPVAQASANPYQQIYSADANHLMPIITPAYPQMCATHNVTQSTKTVIVRELVRADELMNDINMGMKTWKDLFEKHTFFTNGYKHYIAVITASPSKEAQSRWSGAVQARIRRLVSAIDASSMSIGVELAHPFNKGFDRVHRCKPENINDILMGSLQFQVKDIPTEVGASNIAQAAAAECDEETTKMPSMPATNGMKKGDDGLVEFHSTTFYIGLQVPPKGYLAQKPHCLDNS
jgi:poly(A) polymerase